jgi:hypothetical protein
MSAREFSPTMNRFSIVGVLSCSGISLGEEDQNPQELVPILQERLKRFSTEHLNAAGR